MCRARIINEFSTSARKQGRHFIEQILLSLDFNPTNLVNLEFNVIKINTYKSDHTNEIKKRGTQGAREREERKSPYDCRLSWVGTRPVIKQNKEPPHNKITDLEGVPSLPLSRRPWTGCLSPIARAGPPRTGCARDRHSTPLYDGTARRRWSRSMVPLETA